MRRPRWGLSKPWFDSLAPKSPVAWAPIASVGLKSTARDAAGFLWMFAFGFVAWAVIRKLARSQGRFAVGHQRKQVERPGASRPVCLLGIGGFDQSKIPAPKPLAPSLDPSEGFWRGDSIESSIGCDSPALPLDGVMVTPEDGPRLRCEWGVRFSPPVASLSSRSPRGSLTPGRRCGP